MRFLPVLSMVAAGICVSIQGPVNARLRLAVGSPVFSAAFVFFRRFDPFVCRGYRRIRWDWIRISGATECAAMGLFGRRVRHHFRAWLHHRDPPSRSGGGDLFGHRRPDDRFLPDRHVRVLRGR
jgi:hypothetical protein